jgi:hypothetical protein
VRLSSVKPGDIVRADGWHAVVIRKDRRALVVQGICNASMRRLLADEVEAHWRRSAGRAAAPRPPAPQEGARQEPAP